LTSVTKQQSSLMSIYSFWMIRTETCQCWSAIRKLNSFKQLFLRYNTALSSSAPVERLFSLGCLILSKKRKRLSDKLSERLLMLKTNKQFKWRWSGITYYLHLKNGCLSSSCMLFMWTITVNCQWFVWPILFAAIIQNFEIGGIASS